MIRSFTKQLLSAMLSILLVLCTMPMQAQAQAPASSGYSGQGVPLTAAELQQLVAPIALYPDALVAQVLGAASFPDQVTTAAAWLQQNSNLTGKTVVDVVDAQPWDPSVKAITQFPSVLQNLAKNLSWTSALGEAYVTQSADVMTAVQVLRQQALAAGNLKSGSQITVVQQTPQIIVIQSTNPQVVYVPVYNPTVVYGTTYVTPGYSTAAPSIKTFTSPDDAGKGLFEAAGTGDQNAVLGLFGADSKDIILSGDAVQDKAAVEAFLRRYNEMHRWRKMPDGSQILLIGADNFAFRSRLNRTAAASGSSIRRRERMNF